METVGSLVDKITICNLKIFMLENVKRDEDASDEEIADATRTTNKLNSHRNALIDELDEKINEIAMGERQQLFGANKMYGK